MCATKIIKYHPPSLIYNNFIIVGCIEKSFNIDLLKCIVILYPI